MKIRALHFVILIVEDVDRALGFYNGVLGIPVAHRVGAFAQLDTGTTSLALFARNIMEKVINEQLVPPPANAPGFEIAFLVDDVDAVYETMVQAGAPSVLAPTDEPWGQRTAYVRDPDGNLVEVVKDIGRGQVPAQVVAQS